MAVSPILAIPLVAPTQNDKTTTLNDMSLALEGAANDQLAVDMSGGNVTLTATQYTRFNVFNCSGLTADRNLIVPMTKRVFAVRNNSAFSVIVGGTSGAAVTVLAGDGAVVQNTGVDCVGYGSGGSGPPGISGPPGGAINISYVFDASTTNSDPGSGNLRLNLLAQNTATAIYVDVLDQAGSDWTAVLDTLDDSTSSPRGTIRVFERAIPTNWIVFALSAIVSHTGYRELTVTVVGSSTASPFSAGREIALAFDRTGNLGNTGATGATGPTGAPGAGSTPINDGELMANTSGASALPVGMTLSAYLDVALSSTQGTLLYRSGSAWVALATGTAGQVLQTGGASANPSWASAPRHHATPHASRRSG